MTQTNVHEEKKVGEKSEQISPNQHYECCAEGDLLAKFVKMRTLVFLGALLPGLGCYACVAYTYVFQFDRIRDFHADNCPEVHSWIPPVSYAIGVWSPQRYLWMFVVFVHFPPRFTFIVLFRRLFLGNAPHHSGYRAMLRFYMFTLWLEPLGLISVSILDINTMFVLHAGSYAMWLIPFNFNMLFNLLLHHYSRIRGSNKTHEITWRLKVFLFITGLVLSLSTAVSYPFFMATCSAYGYYAFAIAEYLLVGYNSLFYFLSYWEFPKIKLSLGLQRMHTVEKIRIVPTRILEEKQRKIEERKLRAKF